MSEIGGTPQHTASPPKCIHFTGYWPMQPEQQLALGDRVEGGIRGGIQEMFSLVFSKIHFRGGCLGNYCKSITLIRYVLIKFCLCDLALNAPQALLQRPGFLDLIRRSRVRRRSCLETKLVPDTG